MINKQIRLTPKIKYLLHFIRSINLKNCMKILFILIFFLSLQKVYSQDTLKIATWNIEHLDYYKLMGYNSQYYTGQLSNRYGATQATLIQDFIRDMVTSQNIDILFIQEIEPLSWQIAGPTAHNDSFYSQLSFNKYIFCQECYYNARKDSSQVRDSIVPTPPANRFRPRGLSYLGECYGVIYDTLKIKNPVVRSVLDEPTLVNLHMLPKPPLEISFDIESGDSLIAHKIYNYHTSLRFWNNNTKRQIDSLCTNLDGIIVGDLNNELSGVPILNNYLSIDNGTATQGAPTPYSSLDKILMKQRNKTYLLDSGVIHTVGANLITSHTAYTGNKLEKNGDAIKLSDHIVKWASFKFGGNLHLSRSKNPSPDTLFRYNTNTDASDSVVIIGNSFLQKNDRLNISIYEQSVPANILIDTFAVINNTGTINEFIASAKRIADLATQQADTTVAYVIKVQLHDWKNKFIFYIETNTTLQVKIKKENPTYEAIKPTSYDIRYSPSGVPG